MDWTRREFLRSVGAGSAVLWMTGCGGMNCCCPAPAPLPPRKPPRGVFVKQNIVSLLDAGGSTPPQWVRLHFHMLAQEGDFWCWCAAAVSVHRFFGANDGIEQCQVAAAILTDRADACDDPKRANLTGPLDKALSYLGNLAAPMFSDPLEWTEIMEEIDAERPICCRIVWAGGKGAHFVAIRGYLADNEPMVAVVDPQGESGDYTLKAFMKAYRTDGTWVQSYKVTA